MRKVVISLAACLFSSAGFAVTEKSIRSVERPSFAAHFGQFNDAFILGFDYFHRLGALKEFNDIGKMQSGIRFDLDVPLLPNTVANERTGNFETISMLRPAVYFVTQRRLADSPVWGYVGLGGELIYAEELWKNSMSAAATCLYGVQVDTWGQPSQDSVLLHMFLEGQLHVGHERADKIAGNPDLFLGTSLNTGIRVLM